MSVASLLFAQSTISGQTTPEFRAQLRVASKNFALWRTIVNGFNLEQLPIDYREGKVIEKYRAAFEDDLSLAEKLAPKLEKHPMLSDEIAFVSTVQSLVSQLQDMATFVVATQMDTKEDQQKLSLYAQSLAALAGGPGEVLYETSYKDSLSRAARLEHSCTSR